MKMIKRDQEGKQDINNETYLRKKKKKRVYEKKKKKKKIKRISKKLSQC